MGDVEKIEELISELKAACAERDVRPSLLASDIGCTKQWINLLFSGKCQPQSLSEEFVKNANRWLKRCRMCGGKWKTRS